MLFWQHQPDSGTTSGGSWTATTPVFSGALLRHVYIKFTTATTSFDFSLTDQEGRQFINITGNTGILNREYHIPLIGRYTLTISNASANEAFDIRIVAQDGP